MEKNVVLTFEQISILEEICLKKISLCGLYLANGIFLSDSAKSYLEFKQNLYGEILKSLRAV